MSVVQARTVTADQAHQPRLRDPRWSIAAWVSKLRRDKRNGAPKGSVSFNTVPACAGELLESGEHVLGAGHFNTCRVLLDEELRDDTVFNDDGEAL